MISASKWKKRKLVQLSNFAQDLNLETLILVNIFCWNLWHMSDSLSIKIITNLQHIDKLSLPVFFSKRDKLLFRLRERDILGNNNFIKRRALLLFLNVLSSFLAYHRLCNSSNTAGATSGTGTAYPSGARSVFSEVGVARSLVFCLMFCRFWLHVCHL